MQMPLRRDIDEIDQSPLAPAERARLRRMLQDDAYARRFRTTVKVWVISIGTVASLLVATKALLWETIQKFLVK
jgi:hypothetical protein